MLVCFEHGRIAVTEHINVREDDLPGSEASAAWPNYLRAGSSPLLRSLGLYNHKDVVALPRLMERLAGADHG